jgi:ATP-binding cassette subfamily B protein
MNRFFDVINIQKSWFKLVYEGPGAVLEILIGLSLLAFFGTELFLGAAIFMLTGALVIVLGGLGGVKSSIAESAEKYKVAAWLEEMVRCQDSLRLNSRASFWTEEADSRVVEYLRKRRQHFRVLLRQVVLHYLITAVALSLMLGFGGYLVLTGQLSLGQLVAAELVVWSLFKAAEKLLRACEAYFDLLTGLDKIGYITDLPTTSPGAAELAPTSLAAGLVIDSVSFGYSPSKQLLKDITFKVQAGERIAVLGPTGVGKSTLLRLLGGYMTPDGGFVELDTVDLRELTTESKAAAIAYLSERNEIFAGSLMDNVAVGRECDLHRVRQLLDETGGREALRHSKQGGFTPLTSAGSTLSAGEQKSILVSRALLGHPRLLLIDESLGQLSEATLDHLVKEVFQAANRATIISTVALPQIVGACDRVLVLEKGALVEEGTPAKLAANPSSRFSALYPTLSRAVSSANPL